MSSVERFRDHTFRYRLAEREGTFGPTVELLLAGGTVWANDAAYLRADLTSYGLKATEVELGRTHGGTMFRLDDRQVPITHR